ncbi:MAG: glycoside hydrolase [Anaerolineae bacterium]|nr:glycoside hydrolase [Anaerolineae bacterium]
MREREIKYQPELARSFLGSPSLLRLPDGALLATHDYFGPGCPRNHEDEESLTSVYRSEHDGASWQNVTHLMNCYWSVLFQQEASVYLLGTSQQYGSIVIRRSDDGGFTWTHPADAASGLLFRGGAYREAPNYLCTPVPMLLHAGRWYKGCEDHVPAEGLGWAGAFHSCVISAPADSDLLDAANWTMSNKLPFDPAWLPAAWGMLADPGWLEGNAVAAPDGTLWNILRFNSRPLVDKAAMIQIHDQGQRISFDPATGFIDFPGGMTKFTIRHDPYSGGYLALVNPNTDPAWPNQRNVLALAVSDNLRDWRVVKTLMTDDSGLSHEDSIRLTGFQYADWQFDGDDLIYMVRVAQRGAVRYHDANRMVYGVLRNYPQLLAGV